MKLTAKEYKLLISALDRFIMRYSHTTQRINVTPLTKLYSEHKIRDAETLREKLKIKYESLDE